MTAKLIDGRALAARVRKEVAGEVATLRNSHGLATVLVCDHPASAVCVRNKRKQCAEAGMLDLHRHLPADVTHRDTAAVIDELANDSKVTGILLRSPLPGHLDAAALIDRIPPDKDVNGLTPGSTGRLALGRPGLRPCTPAGVSELLDEAAAAGARADVLAEAVTSCPAELAVL